ncbi:DUF4411 family protein [Companilactobacillus muriivasis]|uniref:DUF4411 family protein n=1 Tax=Companilactobacillus muriivasis TaxID=3081444 RepID=UPI0030C66B2F
MSDLSSDAKYVIDSNSFIEPFKRYYSMEHFPSYWAWMEKCLTENDSEIVVPNVVYNELRNSKDRLATWIASYVKPVVFKGYENDPAYFVEYGRIMNYLQDCGFYQRPAIENWSQDWKADPKLIAIASTYNLKIITFEQPAGHLDRRNPMKKEPKIPDVADYMGVSCVSLFQVEDELQLSI